MNDFMLPVASLWWRECRRFYRDRSRVVSSILTGVLFWVLIGFGMGASFVPAGVPGGAGAVEYLYPGTIVFVVLLTAVIGTFSLIEDRRAGFLQGVLVSPIPRIALVAGKVLGGATIGLVQGMLLLPLVVVIGIPTTPGRLALSLVALLLMALALTSVGFVLAWRMDSIHGFHGFVNLLLMPLWFLSGALFPLEGAAGGLRLVMRLDPVTYGLAAFRQTLYGAPVGSIDPILAWSVSITFTAVALAGAAFVARSA